MTGTPIKGGLSPSQAHSGPHFTVASSRTKSPVLFGTTGISALKSHLGVKNRTGMYLLFKLWCGVPLRLFNLPLTEAFRGMLEFQSTFCGTRSVETLCPL